MKLKVKSQRGQRNQPRPKGRGFPFLDEWIMHRAALLGLLLCISSTAFAGGNLKIRHFPQAKRLAAEIHQEHPFTIYCNCKYSAHDIDLKSCNYLIHKDAKRAARLEWEHVVPAEAFGQSFADWREGASACVRHGKKYKGRKCAENNPEFALIESDLYNLWPEVGELNGLRNNFGMAELGAEKAGHGDFGGCQAKIEDRKFEPMAAAKGRVARVYLYMDASYPGRGIISDKNRKLFEAWDRLHPVDAWECTRAKRIAAVQGNENEVLKIRCAAPSHSAGQPLLSSQLENKHSP